MPLGKLSKAQIAKGFEILEDIEKALERKASHFELNSLSSKFYTAIPHDFGRQIPPAIKTAEGLQKKYDMLMVRMGVGSGGCYGFHLWLRDLHV